MHSRPLNSTHPVDSRADTGDISLQGFGREDRSVIHLRLQRILGHNSLAMTARYVQIQTKDLSEVHERFAPGGAALLRKNPGRAKS